MAGTFFELMRGTEREWAEEMDADVPEGTFVFRVKGFKQVPEKDTIACFLSVEKPMNDTGGEFNASKYRLVTANFSKKMLWLVKQFVDATEISLENALEQLPTTIGKLVACKVKHSPSETGKPFINVNSFAKYDPNVVSAPINHNVDDGSLD